jgi:recombination protein RecT
MKLAYLIPRKGKAVLDPSYMGLTKILTDSGSVKKVSAVVVYDDEQFEYNASTRMVVVHEQRYAETEKEHMARKVIGAYSCATLADGSLDYEFMPGWELEKIKSKSDGANSQYSPWQESNWADEMRKKTVIKRHYKYLPKSEQISNVIDLDNQQFIVEKPNLNELFVQQQEQPETNNGELPLDITPDN